MEEHEKKIEKTVKLFRESEKIVGSEYLDIIEPGSMEELKKRGYEITSICDGFQVWIRKIGTKEEDVKYELIGFGESIEEAIDSALPFERMEKKQNMETKTIEELEIELANAKANVKQYDEELAKTDANIRQYDEELAKTYGNLAKIHGELAKLGQQK